MSSQPATIEQQGTRSCLRIPTSVQQYDIIRFSSPETLLIELEEGAKATVAVFLDQAIEHSMDVQLAPSSELTVVTMNQKSPKIVQHGSIDSHAKLCWQNISVGTEKCEHVLLSEVQGTGGESSIDWLFCAKNSDHLDLSVCNVFHAGNGAGRVQMRGVAEGKAHVHCRGMIDIGTGGGGTNTYLTQEVLMLDSTAKVDAVPGLQIKTDNVKASHSATVSKVSREDLFYFGARGIDEAKAREMFIAGFLRDLVQRIADERLRREIMGAIL